MQYYQIVPENSPFPTNGLLYREIRTDRDAEALQKDLQSLENLKWEDEWHAFTKFEEHAIAVHIAVVAIQGYTPQLQLYTVGVSYLSLIVNILFEPWSSIIYTLSRFEPIGQLISFLRVRRYGKTYRCIFVYQMKMVSKI